MSYSATRSIREISGLGDAASVCSDAQVWKTAQLACNAGDAAQCAATSVLPCPAPDVCPSGQAIVRERVPRQSNTGDWGTVAISYCASSFSPAAMTDSAKNNWGLYLGIAVAGLIVFKVATR